jgi:hypothetical protein
MEDVDKRDSESSLQISWRDLKAEARGRMGIIAILIIFVVLAWSLGAFQN